MSGLLRKYAETYIHRGSPEPIYHVIAFIGTFAMIGEFRHHAWLTREGAKHKQEQLASFEADVHSRQQAIQQHDQSIKGHALRIQQAQEVLKNAEKEEAELNGKKDALHNNLQEAQSKLEKQKADLEGKAH